MTTIKFSELQIGDNFYFPAKNSTKPPARIEEYYKKISSEEAEIVFASGVRASRQGNKFDVFVDRDVIFLNSQR